jgi:hypothetical protein
VENTAAAELSPTLPAATETPLAKITPSGTSAAGAPVSTVTLAATNTPTLLATGAQATSVALETNASPLEVWVGAILAVALGAGVYGFVRWKNKKSSRE